MLKHVSGYTFRVNNSVIFGFAYLIKFGPLLEEMIGPFLQESTTLLESFIQRCKTAVHKKRPYCPLVKGGKTWGRTLTTKTVSTPFRPRWAQGCHGQGKISGK